MPSVICSDMIPRGMMLFLEQIGVSLTPDSNDPGLMFYVIIFEKIQNYMTQVHIITER